MKKLLCVAILVAAAVWLRPGLIHLWRGHAVAPAKNLVFDRLWIDHTPTSDTDMIQVFIAVTEQPIGLFNASSQWKGEFELFRYEPREDGELLLLYPQTKTREKVRYQATECHERGFDFCLELKASRGAKRYYSQHGWEIGSVDAARAAIGKLQGK